MRRPSTAGCLSSNVRPQMPKATAFMAELESEFKRASGLEDRSKFKIYYCAVNPAPVVTLGINPGGAPEKTSADGTRQADGTIASASSGYFENGEHDILDCDWKENYGLRDLLLPLVGHDRDRFRKEIVKTNMAFRRSAKKSDIDIEAAISQAAPFLSQILQRVSPRIIVLTGVSIKDFLDRFASSHVLLAPAQKDPGVKQTVFAPAKAKLRATGNEATVVQVAHASQFAWTYSRYNVSARILELAEA